MNPQSSFKDHFSALAAQYAAFRPTYPPRLFDYLAAVAPATDCAWDCACGNGQATVALARHFPRVIGTDASAQQLAAACAHPHVIYRVASAENSGITCASVDLVTVAQALHWFDLPAFYAEVRRVLKQSGLIAVWSYGVLHLEGDRVEALTAEFYSDVVGPFWPPERRLVESGYRELAFPFTGVAAPPFAMEERWNLARLMGYLRTWSATARYVEANGVDPVTDLEARLRPVWGDPLSERAVRWPVALRVGKLA